MRRMWNDWGAARGNEHHWSWRRCADPSGAALAAGAFRGFRSNSNKGGLLEVFLAALLAARPFLYRQLDSVHRHLEQFSHLSSIRWSQRAIPARQPRDMCP